MVSSKFSRRPRVQPKPKVCHPPPPPPPLPPPPPWPTTQMLCRLDWDAVMLPPPDFDLHLDLNLTWIPGSSWYYGETGGWPHYVHICFALDLITGTYNINMMAFQWHMLWTSVNSPPGSVTPGAQIDMTIDAWLGQLPLNVISGRFRT